ncbi:MAG: hypothetical protein AMJ62_07265 [Myxococcales bacterium SG8_38]|nr:MAG: hypothetical protein AMJ62_07265 [Myxococcales bacterium SG8_38]
MLSKRDRVWFGLSALLPLVVWGLGWLGPAELMGDDIVLIVDNQATWASAWTQDSYRAAGVEDVPPVVYRPVGIALLATLKGWLGTTSPIPYRVLAVALHALNTVLLAFWLSGLGLSVVRSLIAASLWSVMPIHAEAIYWASGLLDVMGSSALLAALVLATRHSVAARLGAVGAWVLALLLKETLLFGSIALLFTMAYSPAEPEEADHHAARPPLGAPALVGALALAAWWTARSLAGVEIPESVPLHWTALAASFGEAIVRSVGLGDAFRAGGAPLHGLTLVAGIALGATAWYAWQAARHPARVMLPALSLSTIAAAQVLFGQSEVGFLVDPDRYFYLAVSFIPVTAVCAWNPPAERSTPAAVVATVIVSALIAVWSWSAVEARSDYESFEAMLTREIRIGRASAEVYFLRGVERMKHEVPCAAEMDFRFSFAMAVDPEKRERARKLGIDALQACSDAKAEGVKSRHDAP